LRKKAMAQFQKQMPWNEEMFTKGQGIMTHETVPRFRKRKETAGGRIGQSERRSLEKKRQGKGLE